MKEFVVCLVLFACLMVACLVVGCAGRKADKACKVPCGKCPTGAVCCRFQCPGEACRCLK